jgi:MFS superfamily sulfate permease-like transporter
MLTALFLLSLVAIVLWKPLLRVLFAALLALLVFGGIQLARAIDALVAEPPHQVVNSIQSDAVDDRGR